MCVVGEQFDFCCNCFQIWGMRGWKAVFLLVALLCTLSAVMSRFFLVGHNLKHPPGPTTLHIHPHDEESSSLLNDSATTLHKGPPNGITSSSSETHARHLTPNMSLRTLGQWVSQVWRLRKVRTMILFMLNWSLSSLVFFGSFQFVLLWLQYIGFSDVATALLFACFQLGAGFGQFFGGWLGDVLSKRYPDTGRLSVAIFSYSVAMCLFVVLFWAVPHTTELAGPYCVMLALMGVACNLSMAGCDLPIMSEVVTHDVRASAVAGLQMIAGVVGAFGASIVGLLAQVAYGYVPTNADIDTMDPVTKSNNMKALGNAVAVGVIVPWAGNVISVMFMLRTYPKDRDAVEEDRVRRIREVSREDQPDRFY
eukprot:c9629_g1_i2.p1 GENE.c9629_g1_i2~~c9629_g1_i2.p1  ORF type:complete len:366 (-),score=71.17 c9629_g1_i2:163-1260(-)